MLRFFFAKMCFCVLGENVCFTFFAEKCVFAFLVKK